MFILFISYLFNHMLLFIYYFLKYESLTRQSPIKRMSKRTSNTYIDEKTFEDADPNKQVDKKSESNSSDDAIQKSKRNAKNVIAKDEQITCNQKQTTIKELKNSSEQTATELKIGTKCSGKANNLTNENALMFKSLFENRGQFNLAQSLFGSQATKEIPMTSNSLSYFRHQNDKKNQNLDTETNKKESIFKSPVDIMNLCSKREKSIFNFSSWRNQTNKQSSISTNSSIQNLDNEEQGESADLQREQLLETDPQKSQKRFEYPANCSIIMKVKIIKYKRGTSDLIENLLLTVLHDEVKETYCITISLPATQNSIFSGFISPGKSKIRKLNDKDSFEILVFSLTNDKPKKLQSNRLKLTIAIEAEDSATKFLEKMSQIIERQPK